MQVSSLDTHLCQKQGSPSSSFTLVAWQERGWWVRGHLWHKYMKWGCPFNICYNWLFSYNPVLIKEIWHHLLFRIKLVYFQLGHCIPEYQIIICRLQALVPMVHLKSIPPYWDDSTVTYQVLLTICPAYAMITKIMIQLKLDVVHMLCMDGRWHLRIIFSGRYPIIYSHYQFFREQYINTVLIMLVQ